jgi:hypothetical protein
VCGMCKSWNSVAKAEPEHLLWVETSVRQKNWNHVLRIHVLYQKKLALEAADDMLVRWDVRASPGAERWGKQSEGHGI